MTATEQFNSWLRANAARRRLGIHEVLLLFDKRRVDVCLRTFDQLTDAEVTTAVITKMADETEAAIRYARAHGVSLT